MKQNTSKMVWMTAREIGYEPKTIYWQEFTIAEAFGGVHRVLCVFKSKFKDAQGDYRKLTELVLVLNHKIWQHHGTNKPLAMTYNAIWRAADNYACDNLKGEELNYFYQTTD